MIRLLEKHGWLIVLLISIPAIFWQLDSFSLRDWDEAIYAQIAREMLQGNNWLTPHYEFRPFYEKPPLLFWLTAGFYQLFGISEFTARLATALGGVATVLLSYFTGRKLLNHWCGLISAFILLSSYEFILRSQSGTLDTLLTCFMMISIFSFLNLDKNKNWWYLFGAGFALAFLTKFWAALIIPAGLMIALIWQKQLIPALSSRQFWGGIVLALLLILPWHILMLIEHGAIFWERYVSYNLFKRSGSALEGHQQSALFYLKFLWRFFSPWVLLIPFSLFAAFRHQRRQAPALSILLSTCLIVFLGYSLFVQTKLVWYVFPIFPLVAIFIAIWITDAYRQTTLFQRATAGILLGFSLFVLPNLYVLGIAVLATVIFLLAVAHIRNSFTGIILTLLLITWTTAGISNTLAGNKSLNVWRCYGRQPIPLEHLARRVGGNHKDHSMPIIGVTLNNASPSVEGPTAFYYSGRPFQAAYSSEDLDSLMHNFPQREIIMKATYIDTFKHRYTIEVLDKADRLIYGKITHVNQSAKSEAQ